MEDQILALVRAFFEKMMIPIESLHVMQKRDFHELTYHIDLQTSDSKILIGVQGVTLHQCLHLLQRMVDISLQKWVTLTLDINHYLKEKNDRLSPSSKDHSKDHIPPISEDEIGL